MGKDEEQKEPNPDSKEDNQDNKKETEKQPEEEKSDDEKKNVDELRKVIKLDNQQEKKEAPEQKETENEEFDTTTREGLEQKRAILQSIKDFDFQIKKNQEEITSIYKKLDSVSKDLDDLVSLYEIVSEQMNPFVGLSKVTKKRIDALENFTKEIEELKTRINEIENFTDFSGTQKINIKPESKPVENKVKREPEEAQVKNQETIPRNNFEPVSKSNNFTNGDLDTIIEESLMSLTVDMRIDRAIDDFIENLKPMS